MEASTNKHTLDNGLTVLTREMHHVPLVSHWVWYRVGSRNEEPGKTGISHWVEHMQFKGTPKFPINELDHAISRDGGFWNAMTYLDWTTYFETLPSHKMDIALELEADRMQNSNFDPQETELERTVVISEREGNENQPMFRLNEAIRKAAFSQHPYRHEVIGEMEDLKSITRDNLYEHYKTYYTPANAVISVAGDFKTDDLLARIEELYGDMPAGELPQADIPEEKEFATSNERVEVSGQGDTIYLELTFRSPAANTKDFFSLMVLDSMLTGPSSVAMFGGGSVSNKTSRLYRRLVETDLAVSISGGLQATIDPYLYGILAILPPDRSVDRIIETVDAELAAIRENHIEPAELERAVTQAKALFAYGSESVTNQAFWMGYASMFADADWFETFLQNLEAVTPQDLIDTAEKYLDPEKRVVGLFRPERQGS